MAVAIFDIGEFASRHPNGKSIVSSLGLRALLMGHLTSGREEDDVKQQALLAVSKMMGKVK